MTADPGIALVQAEVPADAGLEMLAAVAALRRALMGTTG
jgi:hypothetical protein